MKNLTDDELKNIVQTEETSDILGIPWHTQAVERCVKTVTEAASTVSGYEARDALYWNSCGSAM